MHKKEKENCLVFMFSIKRESGKFHVIMINDTLRGLQSPKGGFQEGPQLACVASVSVQFRSKERGTRVKDREKNGASKI